MNKICKSKNYKMFKILPFNRRASVRPLLVELMRKYGFIGTVLCVWTDVYGAKELYVADGQHRLLAAEFLGLPVRYEVHDMIGKTETELVEFVGDFNTSSTAWTIENFVHAYAIAKISSYLVLRKIKEKSKYTYSTIAGLLAATLQRGKINLKNGSFTVTSEKQGKEILSILTEAENITPFTNRMVEAFAVFFRGQQNFDKKRFLKGLERVKDQLHDAREYIQYKNIFIEAYKKK